MAEPSLTGTIVTEGKSTGKYCNTDDMKSFLRGYGVTCKIDDETVNDFARFAKSYIDNETQQDFSYHSDVVEFQHGQGKPMLQTRFFPIKKVTHLILYNQTLQAMRTFLDQELIVYPDRGQIALPPIYPVYMTDTPYEALFGNVFISGIYNIEIQYDYGYEVIPEDIKQCACIFVAKRILMAHWASLSSGLSSANVPGYSENYGSSPYQGIFQIWDKEFDRMLSKRKRIYTRSV
jgi:hypothetical protein